MLIELSVQNVLFVKQAVIHPGTGLTVISGETGSGKSLLLASLQLILGGRSSQKLVGQAANMATVTAVFENSPQVACKLEAYVEEYGIFLAADEPIILRRQVSNKGKTQCWINGAAISVAVLKKIGNAIVDIQGQHEPLRLSERARQMRVLDAFGGHGAVGENYTTAYDALCSVQAALEQLQSGMDNSLKERDYCQYVYQEIEQLNPEPEEYERLEQRQTLLAGAQEWRDTAVQATHQLHDTENAIVQQVAQLGAQLSDAPDEGLRNAGELCSEAAALLQDAASQCRSAGESLRSDPQALAETEERMGLWIDLMRKHGGTPASLVQTFHDLGVRIQELSDVEGRIAALEVSAAEHAAAVKKYGKQLEKKRQTAFKKLQKALAPHLADLGMPQAEVLLHAAAQKKADSMGTAHQEFFVRTNPGIEADRIGAVASGGEHARLALALALVLGTSDDIPVMVFDEIDSGVGARLGIAIANKLATLAEGRSVLVITHTPQVAAMAQTHYLVSKQQSAQSTSMRVELLEDDQRLSELTDMLGGGDGAARQAEELLARSQPSDQA